MPGRAETVMTTPIRCKKVWPCPFIREQYMNISHLAMVELSRCQKGSNAPSRSLAPECARRFDWLGCVFPADRKHDRAETPLLIFAQSVFYAGSE